MKKMTRKDYFNIGILIALFLVIVLVLTRFKYVYGSTMDWSSQHWSIPEYFRSLFYETKQLFPSFALNLGAGENIYNFSYYGLLSPFILLSYLFPFIKMPYYIMGISILSIISSIILLYKWLYKRFNSNICFISTLIFLLSSPLIFHSHRHIMFVIYMPFVILSLFGVDNYFDKNKRFLLTIGIFLTIMTNYYFSVGAIIAIICYGIYKYLEINKKIKFKQFIIDGLKFIFPIIVAILMAMVLLLPTLSALLNNRAVTNESINILKTLIPSFNWTLILYSSYALGLTSILFVGVFEKMINREKQDMFLAIIVLICFLFPVVCYILNGTMYINGKVFIPFLPFIVMGVGKSINNIIYNRQNVFKIIIGFSILLLVLVVDYFVIKDNFMLLYLLDFGLVLGGLLLFYKFNNKKIMYITIIFTTLTVCLSVNLSDNLVNKNILKEQYDTSKQQLINKVIKKDSSFYRIGNNTLLLEDINRIYNSNYYSSSMYSSLSNERYRDFYFNKINNEIVFRNNAVMNSNSNLLFNTIMGNKYIISTDKVEGYQLYFTNDNYKIYKNDNVLSLGYVTDSLLSISSYQKLSYPYKELSLIGTAVTKKETSNYNYLYDKVSKVDLNYDIDTNIKITKETGSYKFKTTKNQNKITLNLKDNFKNKVLFIKFNMLNSQSCSLGDTAITINNIKNTLTCKTWKYHNNNYQFNYTVLPTDNLLDIKFTKGTYEITDITVYAMEYIDFINQTNDVEKMQVDLSKTIGDKIEGSINVTKPGIFVLTIPYDKGFEIYVDDQKVDYYLVNEAFIGFDINKGNHKILIKYKAPSLNAGKTISLFGIIIFVVMLIWERRKNK